MTEPRKPRKKAAPKKTTPKKSTRKPRREQEPRDEQFYDRLLDETGRDDEREGQGDVLVFRHPNTQRPVSVPDDVVHSSDRPYRAYQARLTGQHWEQIAHNEGYPDAHAAAYDVERYLDTARSLVSSFSAGKLLELEVARLDALQAAVWPKAMEGELPAVNAAVNLVLSRVKLLGLENAAHAESQENNARTVVVSGDEEGYVRALSDASGGSGAD